MVGDDVGAGGDSVLSGEAKEEIRQALTQLEQAQGILISVGLTGAARLVAEAGDAITLLLIE